MARRSNQNNQGCVSALLYYFAAMFVLIVAIKQLVRG